MGVVFEVTPEGNKTLLHSFDGYPTDGAAPFGGGLLRDTSGNLYGVAEDGGLTGDGIVFKVTPTGTESVLFNFKGGATGGNPIDGLAIDANGNVYGTTLYVGSGSGCPYEGCGVLFKLAPTGKEVVLHNFSASSTSDGGNPYGGVIRDPAGNLYGTLEAGGAYGCGAVFKYTP